MSILTPPSTAKIFGALGRSIHNNAVCAALTARARVSCATGIAWALTARAYTSCNTASIARHADGG